MEIVVIYVIGICLAALYGIYTLIRNMIDGHKENKKIIAEFPKLQKNNSEIQSELFRAKQQISELNAQNEELTKFKNNVSEIQSEFINASVSNLSAIPYMASILADYETYGIEILAQKLDWGSSVERAKKVMSIREIKKATRQMIEQNLESKYQLDYLLGLFPNLQDIIETDYNNLPTIKLEELAEEYDKSRDWLSKEEYQQLNSVERNQLALDRYKESHNKSKWQIGRDYELFVGYLMTKEGYDVDFFGSYMGLEDLGRDLIAKKGNRIVIVQCKYWSKLKQIHEKHILQLYGTVMSYCIENNVSLSNVKGFLITNISLSEVAKKMAKLLNIEYVEYVEKGDYPCIKCNINYDGYGFNTKIYHLPFDQKYDETKIDKKGEFYAMTVQEAEDAGFRRAFRWFGND
jgi:hypothetical protein